MKRIKGLRIGLRSASAILFSLTTVSAIGHGIADLYRDQIDSALGTKSYIIDTTGDTKYKSTYQTGKELMDAAKALSVRQGAEGTVIMKNDNNVFPLVKNTQISLFGGASYVPYMMDAKNSDQILLVDALESAGITLNPALKEIYANIMSEEIKVPGPMPFLPPEIIKKYGPNKKAGDYEDFKVIEVPPSKFGEIGKAGQDYKSKIGSDVGVVTISRPGGEGTTYKPNSQLDFNGKPTNKSPLALSPEELEVIKLAKETCGKVVVLLNTSCTIEVGELLSGETAVDGIAYIGIPNDYQFKGIVQALTGEVNPTGALADTYAVNTMSAPAMMNFGGGYYSDYKDVLYEDKRWPGIELNNDKTGSFGGSASYSGGYYMVQAEGIYTGYNYYETRYYDSVMNDTFNAKSTKGSTDGKAWDYAKEVAYSFGHGLGYLKNEQTLKNVTVQDRKGGMIKATIEVKNTDKTDGLFLTQLYVHTPYTEYDKKNNVEKSAIQFLNSEKVFVKAGETKTVELEIPTKYIASYDEYGAGTYILDDGNYIFSIGAGSHEAVNNVIAAEGKTGDAKGDVSKTFTWNHKEFDKVSFATSDSDGKIENKVENADINYYLDKKDKVTYLSRKDWDATYPVNYNTHKDGKGFALADSPKKDEWMKEIRNEQYTIKTNDPVKNFNGIKGAKFNAESVGYEQLENIDDEYWQKLVDAIPADEVVGAIAHGGSQSDTLSNIENPIVKQNDGPNGFNNTPLSKNNLKKADNDKEDDPNALYYVDPTTEEGKFKANINSQSLLGSCFSPNLALDWGRILGNTGLWTRNYQIWGGGLNYHRCAYNGRNTEYLSEDPMLTNVLGRELIKGTNEFGIINGPKHIGFNDQEHDRGGVSCYMTEQKVRETDLRGFQGAVEEGEALGLMVAFNRVGAINVSHHVGLLKGIIREEWGFDGLMSTDMMNNKYYFNPESSIMATITQMADFASNDASLSQGKTGNDKTWEYISPDAIKNDNALVEAARQALKYQFYAFGRSAILNVKTIRVTPAWETALIATTITTAVLGGLCALGLLSSNVFCRKED